MLERSPFLGAVFESFVASEIVKGQLARGRARELYGFRDAQGLEVDFVVPVGNGKVVLCEAKATSTVRPDDTKGMARLRSAVGDAVRECVLVHRPGPQAPRTSAIAPGMAAVGLEDMLLRLDARR
jgi:predicted AAA+ superfamily ATPase